MALTPLPVAITTDKTDVFGITGKLSAPPGVIYPDTSTPWSVLVNGFPVVTVGGGVSPHGNYQTPTNYGYNPVCAHSKVASGVPTVLVQGKPIAVSGPPKLGSSLLCGHQVIGPANTPVTVFVGVAGAL